MKILFLASKASMQGKVILKYLISKNIEIDVVGLHRYGFPTRNYKNELKLINERIRKDGIIGLFFRIIKIKVINFARLEQGIIETLKYFTQNNFNN